MGRKAEWGEAGEESGGGRGRRKRRMEGEMPEERTLEKTRGEKALEERRRGRAGLRGGLAAAECAAFQYLMTPKYSH